MALPVAFSSPRADGCPLSRLPRPLPPPQAQVPCGQRPLHSPANTRGSPGSDPGSAGDTHRAHNFQGPNFTCGKVSRMPRREGLSGGPSSSAGLLCLDLNSRRKGERGEKQRKPGGSSWKTFFALGRGPSIPRKKPLPWLGGTRARQQPSGQKLAVGVVAGEALWSAPMTLHPLLAGCRPDTVTLRSAKSEESLSSQASGAGE